MTLSKAKQHSVAVGTAKFKKTAVRVRCLKTMKEDFFESMVDCSNHFIKMNILISLRNVHYSSMHKKQRFGYLFIFEDDAKYNVCVESLPGEKWKEFAVNKTGWKYVVSNQARFKVVYNNGKESLKSIFLRKGYKMVSVDGTVIRAHIVIAEAFVPNPNRHGQIDHIDTNPLNNHPGNLRWVLNHKENMNNPKTIENLRRRHRDG